MADRTVSVRLKGDISDYNRAMLGATATTRTFNDSLNTSNDRMTNLVQTSLALGPALVPIGAAGVTALSGLANQLAFATAGASAAAIAFGGVGDALSAVNDYSIDPTTANLDQMNEAMSKLGPAGREFVAYLQTLRPELQRLQDVAQAGLFPGLQAGIDETLTLLPQAERIVGELTGALGELASEAGSSLAGPGWSQFFDFLETEARPTLVDLGRSLGNLTRGFAELWMAFDPISDQFSRGFLNMSRDFAAWADGLDQTEGFESFLEYVQRVGPKAWEALGAVGNALVEIVEAAAPVGEVALPAIEAIADSIAAIADTDLGPALIGIAAITSAYSRLIALGRAAQGGALGALLSRSSFGGVGAAARDLPAATAAYGRYNTAVGRASASVAEGAAIQSRYSTAVRGTARLLGGAGGLAFVMSDLDDKLGLSNAAMLGLAGTMSGPLGAAIGAGVGLAMDFAAANDDLQASLERASEAVSNNAGTLDQQAELIQRAKDELKALQDDSAFLGIGSAAMPEEILAARVQIAELEEARTRNAMSAQEAKFSEAGLAEILRGTSAAYRDETEAVLDNIAAKNNVIEENLRGRAAMRDFEAAIDAASEAAKENGENLNINTEAGRANQAAIDSIASAFNDLSSEQQNSTEVQERARSKVIATAKAMGMEAEEARQLAEDILRIPSEHATEIEVKTDAARKEILDIRRELNAISNRNWFTDLFVRAHAPKSIPGGGGRLTAAASGGHITGPGTGTSDSIPAWLSNGEYVIKAASVAKYGLGFMDALNAGRFADGGYASATRASSPRTQAASASLSGPTHFTGALYLDSGEFLGKVHGIAEGEARRAVDRNNFHQSMAVFS